MSWLVTNTGAELHIGALKLPRGSTMVDTPSLQAANAVTVTGHNGPVCLFAFYESAGRLVVRDESPAAADQPRDGAVQIDLSAPSATEGSATDNAPLAADASAPMRRFKRRG